jgi:thiol-disulfide isomerase/thioredoxin
MKKHKVICTIAVLLFLNCGFAKSQDIGKSFLIKGTLSGTPVDSVLFYYQDATGNYTHQIKPVVNNEFTLNGNISNPVSARILFKKTGEVITRYQQEGRMKEFYIEPGVLTLNGTPADLNSIKLSGSKTEIEFEDLESKTSPIRAEMKPLEEAFMKEKDHEKAAAIHDKFEPYNARIKKLTYQFFLDHPNSYVTLDWMRYYVQSMSLDSSKRVYNNFNDELKATAAAKELITKIEAVEAGMPGSIAPVFTKTDIKSTPLSLADFKGKYVMLDFWASWCVPCRKSNPHMIELYNKYKSKGFDVIGIADDDGKVTVWNAAVAKDGVGIWHNVLRGGNIQMAMKHLKNPDDLDEKYGISSIPTKILIGPDGKILGRYGDSYGGTEEDMDKMLASIFDK